MFTQLITLLALVAAGVATRLVGTLQFNAVGAAFLFSGATVSRKWLAVLAPLGAYFVTDILLNLQWFGSDFNAWKFEATSYVLFVAIALLGMAIGKNPAALRVGTAAVLAAVGFFLVSNFVHWLGSDTYSPTPAGLLTCYTAALPFAGNMLVGNLLFSALLFGGWHYAQPYFAGTPKFAKA